MDEYQDAEDVEFGFQWGVVKVERLSELPDGRKVVRVSTDHATLDVFVSPMGRQITMFAGDNSRLRTEVS